jgi:hypothetical protein
MKSSAIAAATIDLAASVLSSFKEFKIAIVYGTAVAVKTNHATTDSL